MQCFSGLVQPAKCLAPEAAGPGPDTTNILLIVVPAGIIVGRLQLNGQYWNSEMWVVFAYALPEMFADVQPIFIEDLSNPIGIYSKSTY